MPVYLNSLEDSDGKKITIPVGSTVLQATATVTVATSSTQNVTIYTAEQIPVTAEGGRVEGVTPLITNRTQSGTTSDTFTNVGVISPNNLINMMNPINLSGFGTTTTGTDNVETVTTSVRLQIRLYTPLTINYDPNSTLDTPKR